MDSKQLDVFVDFFVQMIELENKVVTIETLREKITSFKDNAMTSDASPADFELIEKKVLARVQVVMGASTVIAERGWTPWVTSRRHEIDDYYWKRYLAYLEKIRKVPKNVRTELDDSTNNVLDLTYDPKAPAPWDRRGLVMGNVQSGKTQHYTGLICKAADAGYRIIIVIAGIHNNLRNQTQKRIDEGFIGLRWSGVPGSPREEVGVSLLDVSNDGRPACFTGAIKDFNRSSAQSLNLPLSALNRPAVFVVKKNSKTLEELITWLSDWNANGVGKINEPLLLIDDEADNASIDVASSPGLVSKINGQIRSLLNLFERSSYVGYTATPFANIFIDPDTEDEMLQEDLFPRSFIIDLEPPSNYFGPRKLFLDEPGSHLRDILDNEHCLPMTHKIDWDVPQLPTSLRRALLVYLLSRGVRILRGDEREHSAMMVNASRFNRVQEQIRVLITDELGRVRDAVRSFAGLGVGATDESQVLRDLKEVLETEFADAGFSWLEILEVLHIAISPIEVVLVNMTRSSDPLQYDAYAAQGRHVVAIGGLSLSRGLTIEGLTVSYFLRNSKMYDTLLQMGRWFGYRNHYEDLVRVWMPPDSADWYEHITEAVEELRGELKLMAASGSSPKDFGLKVRRHPATLLITARNKLGRFGDVTLSTSFSDRLVETVRIRTDEIAANLDAVAWIESELIKNNHRAQDMTTHLEIKDVEPLIVNEFIRRFRNDDSNETTLGTHLVLNYLEAMAQEITSWDIALPTPKVGPGDNVVRACRQFMGYEVCTQLRTPNRIRQRPSSFSFFVSGKQRVSSRGVEAFCLPSDLVERVKANSKNKNVSDSEFRAVRMRPLLMIHFLKPLAPKPNPTDLHDRDALLGAELIEFLDGATGGYYPAWGISFPDFKDRDRSVEARYHVNATWLENEFGAAGLEEDDEPFED